MEENHFGAENLEDGELWLPSDFFSTDEVQEDVGCSSSDPFCMEDFSQLFSPVTFLDHHPYNHFSFSTPLLPTSLSVEPVVGNGFGFNFTGSGPAIEFCGTGIGWTGGSASCQCQYLNRVQTQVESFIGETAWSLQTNRFGLNPVVPGLWAGGHGHGGTGVFLPRVVSNAPIETVPKTQNQRSSRKRHVRINKREVHLPPRKILHNKRPQEECYVAAN